MNTYKYYQYTQMYTQFKCRESIHLILTNMYNYMLYMLYIPIHTITHLYIPFPTNTSQVQTNIHQYVQYVTWSCITIQTIRYHTYQYIHAYQYMPIHIYKGCLAQVGNGMELDTVGRQFKPYLWLPCGVTWDVVPKQS